MPELPEVETMRRGLLGLQDMQITDATFPLSHLRPLSILPAPAVLARRLKGRRITQIGRLGKRVTLELSATSATAEEPLFLVIEPRMTGLLLVTPSPSQEHVRCVLRLHQRGRPDRFLTFWDRRGLGTIRLANAGDLTAIRGRLGPDGLTITAAELADRLGRSRRAVKVALLDQQAVAGIGNIYAAEILHRSGIDPRTLCQQLRGPAWERIASFTREVLREAIRFEGSSIGDETYRTADSRPGRFQRRHRVYGRSGLPCPGCQVLIRRIVQAQRSTFFCPTCQRRPR
jgi:formamidopyrimidine-DNA glycosylase